jgi:hypothetical protein
VLLGTLLVEENQKSQAISSLSLVSISVCQIGCCLENARSEKTQRKRIKITQEYHNHQETLLGSSDEEKA